MSWGNFAPLAPSFIALLGIPAAVALSWWKDKNFRKAQEEREDTLRHEQQRREDALLAQQSQNWIDQQWWNRKAEAYTLIADGLYQWSFYLNGIISKLEGQPLFELENQEDRIQRLIEVQQRLGRLATMGNFIISDEAAACLDRYFDEVKMIGHDDDPKMQAEIDRNLTRRCLDEIREAARKDLKIAKD